MSIVAAIALATAVDTAAERLMATTKTPALAVAVVRGDQIAYAKGFGGVTEHTDFQIGSLTKAITAATVVSLAHDGTLKLDAPVSKYVTGLDPALGKISIDRLLSQTSGLRDEPAEYGTHEENALAAYVRSWHGSYAILPPGVAFSYSNPGYALAGLVAQEAAGKPFADLVAERVFAPLGMKQSTLRPTEAMVFPLAVGHTGKRGETPSPIRAFADDTRHWPAGYVYSSANDLARFAIALLNDARMRDLLIPRTDVPHNLAPAQYGYGLFIERYRGVPSVWHAGEMPGFSALMRLFPNEKLGVIALANRDGVRMEPILDAVLEAEQIQTQKAPDAKPDVLAISRDEMQSLAGHYVNRFPVDVFVRDEKLWIRRPDGERQLEKIGPHRFTTDSSRSFRPAETEIHKKYLTMYLWAFVKESAPAEDKP